MIDWFCAPRFDSPSVFGSLLDLQKGGQFSISPVDTDFTTKQLYFPDTGVLITRFMAECGVAEIHDFMPIENPGQPSERHRIVRMVKVPRGEVRLQMEVAPRFDYGRATHTLESTEDGAVFTEREDDAHAALDGAARGPARTMSSASSSCGPVMWVGSSSSPHRVRHRVTSTRRSSTTASVRRSPRGAVGSRARPTKAGGATW